MRKLCLYYLGQETRGRHTGRIIDKKMIIIVENTYRSVVWVGYMNRPFQARFAQVPILPMIVLAKKLQQGGHIYIIVIIKVAKPPTWKSNNNNSSINV